MAAGHYQNHALSRVRGTRVHGKPSAFSGLRVVLAAAAITVAILFVAFGAIGMLMLARAPQEPVAKLDPAPPVVMPQAETPQEALQETPQETPPLETATSIHEKTPEAVEPEQADKKEEPENKDEIEKRTVKTFRVIAPPASPAEPNETVAEEKKPEPDPETTAAIPPQAKEKQPPRRVQKRPPRQRQTVRRPVPDKQSDNPFLQLFGIKKYR